VGHWDRLYSWVVDLPNSAEFNEAYSSAVVSDVLTSRSFVLDRRELPQLDVPLPTILAFSYALAVL